MPWGAGSEIGKILILFVPPLIHSSYQINCFIVVRASPMVLNCVVDIGYWGFGGVTR